MYKECSAYHQEELQMSLLKNENDHGVSIVASQDIEKTRAENFIENPSIRNQGKTVEVRVPSWD